MHNHHHHGHKKQGSGILFKVILPVIAAVLCAVGFLVYQHYSITDKQKLDTAVKQLIDDAQNKNVRGILDRMTEEYSDNIYKSRKQIAEHLRLWAVHELSNKVILTASSITTEIAPSGDKATAEFTVTGNKPIEEVKRHYRSNGKVRLHFVKRDNEWFLNATEPLD